MIDKSLAKLTKRKGEKIQMNKIRHEKGIITTDTCEIQRIIGNYFENLYSNKLEVLEDTDKILDTYELPKLNQGIRKKPK